ncbi:MAG: penicillin-binding protein, partial [Pseudomonadota bacterium]
DDHGSFRRPQPPGTVFVKIDRYTGQRVGNGAAGGNIVSELFRAGEEPAVGQSGNFVDGGFAMSADLPLFNQPGSGNVTTTVTSEGQRKVIPTAPSLGQLTSGGLY